MSFDNGHRIRLGTRGVGDWIRRGGVKAIVLLLIVGADMGRRDGYSADDRDRHRQPLEGDSAFGLAVAVREACTNPYACPK